MDPQPAYQDTTLPIEGRVDDLVSRMTLEEKISQMVYDAPSNDWICPNITGGTSACTVSGGPGSPRSSSRSDWLQRDLTEENVAQVRRLAPLAQELELEMSQLALAWILRRPAISAVITGVTRPEHVLSNVKASGVRLTPDMLEEIEGILENAPADE